MLDVTCDVKKSGPIVPLARTRGSPVTYLCSDFGRFPSSFASSTSAYWAPGAAAAPGPAADVPGALRTSLEQVGGAPVFFDEVEPQPAVSSASDSAVTA